jgi:hypothetical protein
MSYAVTLQQRIENAEAAVMELSMFFIRHNLPYWPEQMAPVLQALRDADGRSALTLWGTLALMGEYGLMQTRIEYDLGYRAADMNAEQRHFDGLLQQALDAVNNLRFHLRSGLNKPLLSIYHDDAP